MGDLVENFPTSGHTLKIVNIPLECFENYGRNFLIKRLTLVGTKLIGRIDSVISNHFPYLHLLAPRIVIRQCATLIFPQHHFSYLKITDQDGRYILCLVTSGRKNNRYYRVGENGYGDSRILNLIFFGSPNEKLVTIIRGSVKTLVLNKIEPNLNSHHAELEN